MKTTGIFKALEEHNFPDDVRSQFERVKESKGNWLKKKAGYIGIMDNLLTEEQRLLLWERGGMCTGGETGVQCKKLARELRGRPLAEKVELANQNGHIYRHHLNEDGTITAYCFCHCLQDRYNKTKPVKLPSEYGCAAGAAFHNLQIALGVKGRITSIDYPRDGDGKKFMTFTFEVVE